MQGVIKSEVKILRQLTNLFRARSCHNHVNTCHNHVNTYFYLFLLSIIHTISFHLKSISADLVLCSIHVVLIITRFRDRAWRSKLNLSYWMSTRSGIGSASLNILFFRGVRQSAFKTKDGFHLRTSGTCEGRSDGKLDNCFLPFFSFKEVCHFV